MGTRSGSLADLHVAIASGVGGVPLGWLTQIASIHLLGYSVEAARLPSALFSVGCCVLLALLAGQLHLKSGALAVCVFAFIPLQFRYALEARPYMQGIFCGLLATYLYVRFLRRPRFLGGCFYALAVTLCLYSQPLSFLIPLGLTVYSFAEPAVRRRMIVCAIASDLLAVLLFMPWYLYAKPVWQKAISSLPPFHLPLKTPILIVHEMSGAGWAGSAVLVILAAIGFVKPQERALARIAISCISVCLVGGLLLDLWFGYFLAVRQFIFMLPFLALLAAEGLAAIRVRNPRSAVAVCGACLLLFAGYDYWWMVKPRENWQLAAQTLDREVDNDTCIAPNPDNGLPFLIFFVPRLAEKQCSPGHAYRRFIVVRPPYARAEPLPFPCHPLAHQIVGQISLNAYLMVPGTN